MDAEQRTRAVMAAGEAMGFALVGVARAAPGDRGAFFRDWLAAGRHGEMDYLARHLDLRLDPAALLPGARSVICVADRYAGKASRHRGNEATGGRVARYAWGRDYHKTIKKRLHALADRLAAEHPGAQFRTTVDTAPLHEREHAARAGLGWIGKHTLLLHPRKGSWLLLGTIVTTLDLADSESLDWPGDLLPPTDHCGTCTRCIDACPTQCLTPYAIDATRCISYLTLEHRSPIEPSLHAAMGDWVAGCDVCQEVCPHNRGTGGGDQGSGNAEEGSSDSFDLLAVLGWSEDDRREHFRGSALKRIKLDMMKRNALIAAGNHLKTQTPSLEERRDEEPDHDAALRRRIEQIADDETEPELVRVTAKQVLAGLARTGPASS